MLTTARALPLLLLVAAASCAPREPTPPPPRPDLRWYVKQLPDTPNLQVTLVGENVLSDSLDFSFPVWLPGDFGSIEPGKWVEDVRAYDRAATELAVRRLGPNAWRVFPRGTPYFLITYLLHPVRPDGFKRALISELTRSGGYFTGAVAFGTLTGLETLPVSLTFELGARWPAICSLEEEGPARYRAASAHELAQAACSFGPRLRELEVEAGPGDHRLVLVAPPEFRSDSLLEVAADVVRAQQLVFDSRAYPEYTFFVHFVPATTTGLGAAALFRGSAYYLPVLEDDRIRSSGIPGLLAHQLAHAWTLWRFAPAELVRPPLGAPVSTRALWLVEGLAEHAARMALARAGVVPRAEVYADIARNLEALASRPEAARANLETASAAATRGAERSSEEWLALKSPLAVLALDVEMRRASGNAFGMDSLVGLLDRAAEEGRSVPYDSIVQGMLQLGGAPVRSLYASAIAGAGALPAAEILRAAGLELVTREVEVLNLGAALVPDSASSLVFRDVQPGSIAAGMGLRGGDRLLQVNGQPVSPADVLPLMAVLADLRSGVRVGEPVRLRVRRGGSELELTGELRPWTRQVRAVVEDPGAAPPQAAIREALFSPRRDEPPARAAAAAAGS